MAGDPTRSAAAIDTARPPDRLNDQLTPVFEPYRSMAESQKLHPACALGRILLVINVLSATATRGSRE
jgi:hypothetical protein